jgi:DNA-binding NarL/FixJ family response regulator
MKILMVDDHVLIREALRGVLTELKGDAEIVEALNSRQAMQCIEDHPDIELVLLDLNLPDRSGFEVLAELRERYPAISVVVLSGNEEQGSISKALDFGALGFIPKSARREVMLSAFKLVFAGGIYVPPEILSRPQPALAASVESKPPPSAAELGLTERQMDVLVLMMQGKSNKAICRDLDLAEATVKNHVTAILKALKATNRTEAVIAAAAFGLGTRKDSG